MADKEQAGTVDIPLSKAITISGASVKGLRMREPTVADQLAMDAAAGSDAVKELHMFASLCMVAPADLHQLGLRDYKKVQDTFRAFVI